MSTVKAETLDRFYETLEPRPLIDSDGLATFYYQELNDVRGDDNVARLAQELGRAFGRKHFRAFLAGHSGCGKSTELSRLASTVSSQYRVIRFSAKDEMHPSSAKPFDVLILMMLRLGEEIAKPQAEGGLGWQPNASLSRKVLDWFASEEVSTKTAVDTSASLAAGAGIDADSLWAKALGLFGRLKGEVKFASQREKKVIDYRISRLPELIALVNDFFDACNDVLKERHKQEWLFLGEDFEKLLDSSIPQTFFVKESQVFSSLRTHLIFTIPVDLAWAERGVSLPFVTYLIRDTPVYDQDNRPDRGRDALRALLNKRVNLALFETGQLDRLIVASGGHLRDLFLLIKEASDLALLANPPAAAIRQPDATKSIAKLRQEVTLRLGDSPYDPAPISWTERAEKLKKVHEQAADAKVPDAALHALCVPGRYRSLTVSAGSPWRRWWWIF
ncbi:MAG: hypothetical protein K2X03_21760 [Bryobacteraceae bacterium]|nr:hypothetical protein [Bryobacteraceae bacterium]